MTLHTIMAQFTPGISTVYVAGFISDVESFTYETLAEAEVKLTELQAAETGSRSYYIYTYEQSI